MGSAKQNELGPHLPERSRLRHSQWAAGSLLFGLFVLSLACGHDAERENPLDPTLTPPVELQAELHDSTGAVHLSWSTYDGIQPLAAYLVLRNVARSTTLDTLVSITHVDSTRFIDATLAPDTAYEYRVAAINDGGLAQPSAIHRIDGFRTTAVQLTARADAATGAIHLAWSQYLDPGFEGYTLLRRAAGTDVDEALYQNDEASDTTYVDSTVLHGVEYGYRVVSSAAGQQQSSTAQLAGVQLSAPELISIDLDSRTAQATLAWTSYGGPRFSHYEVVRLVEGEVPAVVAMLDAITDTTLVDSGLHGNTFYRYKVVVATTAGERPESGELHGTFHEQVATWPLDIPEDAAVRLEFRDGELEALVASKDSVALRSLSRDGVLQERQLLYSNGFLFDIERPILPAATAMAARPDGSRHLVIAQQDRVMLQAHDALGAPAWRLLLEEQQTTEDPGSGGFRIVGSPAFFEEIRIGGRFTYIDRIVGRVAGETVLVEDFFNSDVGPLQVSTITFSTLEQTYPLFDNGLAVLIMNLVGNKAPGFSGDLQSTSSPGIEVQAALGASARLLLVMDVPAVVAVDMFRRTVELLQFANSPALPLPLLPLQPFRLHLGYQGNVVVVRLEDPFADVFERPVSGWASAVAVDDLVLFSVDETVYAYRPETDAPASAIAATEPTSFMATWEQDRRTFIAMCLPESHRVLTGRLSVSSFSGSVTLPQESAETTLVLGSGFGRGDGAMAFPLSYARGPEGRQYVLDAGNGRIQVFDANDAYLTQWQGSEGGFDFGGGHVSTDFRGSTAVDDDGFIYVADVGNRRIQKFAP